MERKTPLTRQQEVLWIEYKLDPLNVSYNMCVQQRLQGPLNVDRFQRAISAVVAYFDAFRSYFKEIDGVPHQLVMPESDFCPPHVDLSGGAPMETPDTRKAALEFMAAKLQEPIRLDAFPIIRGYLVQSAADVFYFVGMVPHIVSDAYSALLLLEAISTAYEGGLPALAAAYDETHREQDDYLRYLKEHPPRIPLEQSQRHWHEVLQDATFLVDFGRNTGPTFHLHEGRRHYFSVTDEQAAALKALAARERTTLFFVLGGLFNTLLYLYFNSRDIIIGYPVSIRPPGFKHCFGFFVNIVPLRVQLDGETRFSDLVRDMTARRKRDKRHQHIPGLDIVKVLREHSPQFPGRVFNIALSQTLVRQQRLSIAGIQADAVPIDYTQVNEDLMLYYEMEPRQLNFMIDYKTAVFEEAFIERFVAHFKQVVQVVIEDPEVRLDEIRLLTPSESETVLDRWQRTGSDYRREATLVSLFDEAVAAHGAATALICGDARLSYAALDRRSTRLAAMLRGHGVRRGDCVGVAMHRCNDMLVALYGVLKAGAAYVPLDPGYPSARVAFMLTDCGARVVLTHARLAEGLPEYDGTVVNLDDVAADLAADGPPPEISDPPQPRDTAYLIYTSGSTGTPKGVLVSHHNIACRIQGLQREFPLEPGACSLQNTVYSFDVSVTELFWPLCVGACNVLTPAGEHKNPRTIIRLIDTHRITLASFVPSMINALAVQISPGECAGLKTVISIGETLTHALKVRFYEGFRHSTLYNFYGPTEVTVYATYDTTTAGDDAALNSIGRCLPDTTAFILNSRLVPQPPGVAGELVLGGPGVAAGYLNRPSLTADRFIPDPFDATPGARLYRTGDLARFLPDGRIEFLGRMDTQVKIRGFRVELGEIETALMELEPVKEAVVVARGPADSLKLAAYLVFRRTPLSPAELRGHLARRLPDYMVPSHITVLDSFPQTQSGKINRQALPEPTTDTGENEYVAPRTDLERRLVDLWARKLRLDPDRIGIHDSFFELGGDSLMMIQMSTELEKLGLVVEPHDLFVHPTVAEVSNALAPLDNPAPRGRAAAGGQYPLLPRQAMFFEDPIVNRGHWNRFFLFTVRGDLAVEHLHTCLDLLIEQHPGLRTAFVSVNGNTWQQISDEVPRDYFSVIDLSGRDDADAELERTVNAAQAALDVTRPLLLRVLVFKRAPAHYTIAMIIHHLLVDISSTRVLLEDLLTLMQSPRPRAAAAMLAGTAAPLSEWSQRVHAFIGSHAALLDDEIDFWRQLPSDPVPCLPMDGRPDADANLEAHKAGSQILVPADVTRGLFNRVTPDTPIQVLLYTALAQAICDWTDGRQVLFNTAGHGRHGKSPLFDGVNLARTVGWINIVFPFWVALEDVDNTDAALTAVSRQMHAIPFRGQHFGILRYLYPRGIEALRDRAYPEIFFNYVSHVDAMIPEGMPFEPASVPETIHYSAPENDLIYRLYMEGGIYEERLTIELAYSRRLFQPATIEGFATAFQKRLAGLAHG